MGMPSTGKHVDTGGMGVYRVVDGQIAEEWVLEDRMGVMQQFGRLTLGALCRERRLSTGRRLRDAERRASDGEVRGGLPRAPARIQTVPPRSVLAGHEGAL